MWKSFAKATQPVGREVRSQMHSSADRPSILSGPRLQACCGAQWGPSLANAMQSIWLSHAGVQKSQEALPECWRQG